MRLDDTSLGFWRYRQQSRLQPIDSVPFQCPIGSQKRQTFEQCLRHDHPIERIAMHPRK